MNEEKVDNSLVDSPRDSPKRTPTPTLASMIIPKDIYKEEEKEESKNEFDSLSPELGFVATKPSAKAATTLMEKDFVQTESIPNPTKR